jgi:hypothetical protein
LSQQLAGIRCQARDSADSIDSIEHCSRFEAMAHGFALLAILRQQPIDGLTSAR